MNIIISFIAIPFSYVIEWCYSIFGNYGVAIIVFTLLTKVIQLPLTIWIQFNSIKMVKIQPQINRIHAKYYGDNNTIAEKESEMYKKEKYNPFITLIPLFIQVILLLGVAAAINNMRDGIFFTGIENVDFSFLGLDLSLVPSEIVFSLPIIAIVTPIIAGFSAWLMCFCQNKSNVLQAEQGSINKYGLMALSVALSLYLGYFVSLGMALYWICSNLFSTLQLYIINFFIPPKKYVDYEALDESRKELAELKSATKINEVSKEDKKREKEDYKRFFSIADKYIVIYSERSGFYKYYEDIINGLLSRVDMNIHYITNDPNDQIFEIAKHNEFIKPYYIGVKKLITLFMKLEASIVIMTTPDLENMYFKRSLYKKDIEYIYVPHESSSMFFGFNDHAFDYFDTIFSVGPHIDKEHKKTEEIYGLKAKKMIHFGYPILEHLAESNEKIANETHKKKQILIGPSWQEDNILDSCIDELIDQLYCDDYHIIIRPHPEYMKRYKPKMDAIVEKYKEKIGDNLSFELDFSVNSSIYSSDLLIADWSSLSLEFAFSTLKPVLFINTKPKIENPNWERVGIEPQDLQLRDIIGVSLEMNQLDKVRDTVIMLFDDNNYKDKLLKFRNEYYYNYGTHGKVGVDYLVERLKEIINKE